MTVNYDELTRKLEKLNSYRPLDKIQLSRLEKDIRIEHVWSSNAIEGSTLDKNETAIVLEQGLTVNGKSLKNHLEAVDLNNAYNMMTDLVANKQPLTEMIIRSLNQIVNEKIVEHSMAGQYRAVDVYPKGGALDTYAKTYEIRPRMEELIRWSDENKDIIHPVKYAADLHAKFVTIHPFIDGNGRTARLLMNFALTEYGYPIVNVQPDKESREKYMRALQSFSEKNDLEPFEELIGNYVDQTLNKRIEILAAAEGEVEKAKEAAKLTNLYRNQNNQN